MLEPEQLPKIGFLFISWVVISSGFVTQVLPCSTQNILDRNFYVKHIIGILISFIFIMLEGGWSFNQEEEKLHSVDWSNGNVIDSMIYSIILYVIFLMTSKMHLRDNLILYVILFAMYCINTQRNYWINRDLITGETDEKLMRTTYVLLYISIIVFMFGFIRYLNYKKKEYGKRFSIFKFLVEDMPCKHTHKSERLFTLELK